MIPCTGCANKHLSTARVFLDEVGEEISSERDYRKISEAIGNLSHAEEHSVSKEMRNQIRGIRKRIEASIAKGIVPDVGDEITGKAAENLKLIKENPELCPSCEFEFGGEVEHV